ncbi:MAG: hypothetical protein OIF34_11475, partial [Porticoccaceae bacterium]|nr:hypothetical protein [Porticoccaceae bacterium]
MSIFDDDQAESVATARADKKAHKNPFADPEERLEPLMHEGSELDDDELALEEEEFVPLDRKRNRHLSSSLDKIRDNGPASTAREPAPQEDVKPAPAPKASPQPQEARNPFAGSEASTAEPKPAPVNNPFLPPTAGTSPKPRTKPAANRQASHDKIFAGEKLTIEKPRSRNTEPDDTSPAPQKKPRQAEQPRQRPQPRPET